MSKLVNTEGACLDPLEAACQNITAQLNASLYGTDTEARIYALRRSILGDEAGESPSQIRGLAAVVGG